MLELFKQPPDKGKAQPMHKLKALDLFAGTGWGVACQRLGIDEMGVEIMPEAVETRAANGMHTIYRDVWEGLTGPSLSYDLLIASPPCQTFSMAGHGAGRKALDEVIEAIELHAYKDPQALRDFGEKHDMRTALVLTPLAHVWRDRPRLVALEQVPTVLPVWEACAVIMRELGYDVKVAALQAERYGVPQTRKRAILVARLDGEAKLPTPTHSRYYSTDPAKLDPGVKKWVTMADALGEGGFTAEKVMGKGMVERHGTRPGRTADQPAFTIRASAGGMEPGGFVLRRGLNNRPAPTITGGGTETGGAEPIAKFHERYTHLPAWEGPTDRLTPAECATLQSYPKDFTWIGSKTNKFLQIGNAVPPLLAEVILTELTAPAVAALPVAA
jgi:DNA (cytosine-5)-methyltransferase 1